MADSRDQGKRYGMSNIRSHKLGDRSSGVEQDQRGHADCESGRRVQAKTIIAIEGGSRGLKPCTLKSGYWLVGIVDWPDRAGLPGVARESPCFEHLERTCTPAGRPRRKSRGRLRLELGRQKPCVA
jgi:hypothetical protein